MMIYRGFASRTGNVELGFPHRRSYHAIRGLKNRMCKKKCCILCMSVLLCLSFYGKTIFTFELVEDCLVDVLIVLISLMVDPGV